jgi:hypothetical protein
MRIIDDPLDPVFVTVGPSAGRVELQIGEEIRTRYARLTPAEARRLARALLEAADQIEPPAR